jgi:ribosomal protein L12E/L44/L45/RPP1/RPP2
MDKQIVLSTRLNIVNLFNKVGKTSGTIPPTKGRVTAVLHEYFLSRVLLRLAETREESAKEHLLKLMKERGFDPEKVAIGDTVAALSDDKHYFLSLKVTNPPIKVNIEKLKTELIESGVPEETIEEAVFNAEEVGTAAKIYTIIQR